MASSLTEVKAHKTQVGKLGRLKSSTIVMADDDERPQVLVLGPPTSFPIIESLYSHKFHFLNPKTSSLPLHQFLTADNRHPSSIRAVLCCTRSPVSGELRGKRVGIVGLGSIGKEAAKRLEAFGCIISYTSKNKKPLVSYPFYESILELASVSEALILCCELNKETKHMVNREVLMAIGKEGIIVNVARGSIIDEKELVKCLVEREIGGAGLDVFENEPHVPKELFELDNVVLSPHAAVHTNESVMATSELMAANLEAFFSNKPLLTPVIL